MSGLQGEDAFVRRLYPDYDKEGLIIDVRHNVGGNIDSWLLTSLQRKAWMYFQGRATNVTNGGLGWDDQFAFRGHIVVLVDEKVSSTYLCIWWCLQRFQLPIVFLHFLFSKWHIL